MWKGSRAGIVVIAVVLVVAAFIVVGQSFGGDTQGIIEAFRELKERLGIWAMPLYVMTHTITLALCLPAAMIFEAGAAVLFGFFKGVLCVFSAKVLGASLSFWIGRALFRSSSSAISWVQKNKYFHILTKGVARDGWRFVLLARFSPVPSYVINYALAATDVRFFVDFLIPTVLGCLPMILQNASIGSLTSAAVVSDSNEQKHLSSYLLPLVGIASSVLISLRIKKYSSEIVVLDQISHEHGSTNKQMEDVNMGDLDETICAEHEDEKSCLRKRVSSCVTG